jgi:cytochrome b6-f complex iron-sulfur subunit
MSIMKRRQFLSGLWVAGLGFVALAAAWTSWDLLRPGEAKGFGGKIRALPPESVTEGAVIEVSAARSYLTDVNDDIRGLSWKCSHLGCKVSFCDSSGQFECPCHGSVFNRAGDLLSGPSPRGMDEHPVEVGADGLIYIDTGVVEDGAPPGTVTIDEPARGPSCSEGSH